MLMYKIYHIPGRRKIGCTEDIKTRMRSQVAIDWEILEEHDDIYEASRRELELQAEYGYPIDTSPYYVSAIAGKQGGANSHQKGTSELQLQQLARVRNPQKAADARTRKTCVHCGLEALSSNITKWHNDKCKWK